jgi:hypothetical protein
MENDLDMYNNGDEFSSLNTTINLYNSSLEESYILSNEFLSELEEKIFRIIPKDYPEKNKICDRVREKLISSVLRNNTEIRNLKSYISSMIDSEYESMNCFSLKHRPYLNVPSKEIVSWMHDKIKHYNEHLDSKIFTQEFLDKLDEFVVRLLNTNFAKNFYKNREEHKIICDRVRYNFFKYLIKNNKKIDNLQAYLRIVVKGNCSAYLQDQYKRPKTISLEDWYESDIVDYKLYGAVATGNKIGDVPTESVDPRLKYDLLNLTGFTLNSFKKDILKRFGTEEGTLIFWLVIFSACMDNFYYIDKYYSENSKKFILIKIFVVMLKRIIKENEL